jgi:hypothetical protein
VLLWRVVLLVGVVIALSLGGVALYLHQVDRYPLRAVPTLNSRANAARSCSLQSVPSFTTFSWASPDGQTFQTKSDCADYVQAHKLAIPDRQPAAIRSINSHNRREREIEWLEFAAAATVALAATSALLLFGRRRRAA